LASEEVQEPMEPYEWEEFGDVMENYDANDEFYKGY